MDQYIKQIYNDGELFSVVDVFNKKKFQVLNYLEFLKLPIEEKFHLAEIPLENSPLIVDVDIKEEGEEPKKLYNDFVIKEILLSYVKILDDLLTKKPKTYKIILLEKPPYLKNGFIKSGFHLHFISVSLCKKDLNKVYEEVLKISEFSDYLDNVTSKPWLIYGASKDPQSDPYLISKCFIVEDEVITETNHLNIFVGEKIFNIEITQNNIHEMLKTIMSIRLSKNFSLQKTYKLKNSESEEEINIKEIKEINYVNISSEKISELVMSLKKERATDYTEWLSVLMILVNIAKTRKNEIEYFKNLFHLFSQKSENYDEIGCDNKWDSIMKTYYEGGLHIGSLIYKAKQDNKVEDVKDLIIDLNLEFIPVNDYDIARKVKEIIPESFITHKDYGCFRFESTIWKEVSGWDSIFKRYISIWSNSYVGKIRTKINTLAITKDEPNYEKLVTEPLKTVARLEKKIKNYSSLNNISKSMFDLYFDEELYQIFTQKQYMIAFKNKMFDVKKWKINPVLGEHYLSNRIEHELIEWADVPEENKKFVEGFWEKIFPDKELREYNLKNFARFLTGENTFKQFQFWTGTGNNGKSVCINLMEQIFGRMTMKIPKTLITGSSIKHGGATPELYRLKDARLAIIDEVTNNDFLDPGQIKGLTGNDKLYGRDLYQKSKDINEIIPTFFPILITNEIPIIKKPDDATWGRVRLINFESKFKSNPEQYLKDHPEEDPSKVFKSDPKIYQQLKENAKYFLSQLVDQLFQYGSFEEFNMEEIIPPKVEEGLAKFKQGQNILKQYIQENFIVDENSPEIISAGKLLKEYNASRPKVVLNIEELKAAVKEYSESPFGKGIIINNEIIKGLVRIEF